MFHSLASLAIGLSVCSLAAVSGAEDGASEEVLKGHDLRRSGTTYILPAEAEVQKKLNEARALYQRLTYAQARQRELEYGTANAKQMTQQMTQQRILLNQQLTQANSVQDHNRLVAMINQLSDQIDLMNQQVNDPAMRKEVNSQVPISREAYMQAVLDLRQLVDKATAAYEELAKDEEVTAALGALGQKAKVKPALGPSRTFLANVKLLEKVEGSVLTESVELRKEGGIYWVDVTFNGKVTKPLAFDTGASSIVLPAAMAAEIGLKPGKGDPTVKAQVADGSVIEAKEMTIPSVRVGKFTVKNVTCIVMPAEKEDVPPLLGQTFLKNFTHKFSGDSGRLVLSQVETPEAEKAAPQPKTTTRSPRTKRPSQTQAPSIERSPNPGSPR
jgi:clan AA aspartic protease (TIGR02281 family)